MTTYTFIGNANMQSVAWNDSMVWTGGVSPNLFPNSPTADVVIPKITRSDGSIYTSFITIGSGQSFAADSVSLMNNDLIMDGTLSVGNAVALKTGGEIDLSGTLSAGSLTLETGSIDIQGSGQINVTGTVTNDAMIVGSGLSVSAAAFDNVGSLVASGNLTVTVSSGGFSNLSGSTLTGGTYEATGANGVLDLDIGAVIATDAANILLLNGGDIRSFDPVGSQYVSLQASLTTIAQGGTLGLTNQAFNPTASPITVC